MWVIVFVRGDGSEHVPIHRAFVDEASAWLAAAKYERENNLLAGSVTIKRR
jgi:hypothetical protein